MTFKSSKKKAVEAVWKQIEAAVALGTYRDEDFVRYWVRPPADCIARKRTEAAEQRRRAKERRRKATTVVQFAEKWLGEKEASISPSCLRDYRSAMEKHVLPCLGDRELSKITAEDIAELKAYIRRPEMKTRYKRDETGQIVRGKRGKKLREEVKVVPSPRRVNNILIPLKTMLREAHERGLIDRIPTVKKEKVPKRRQIDPLSEDEVGLFLEKVPHDLRAFFAFAFGTGVRVPGEATAIRVGDID